MSSEIGVAVWGIGRHAARRLLPAIVQTRGIRLVGICTRDSERGGAKAAELGCDYFATSERMLGDERVSAVILATPTGLHFEHGLRVIEGGKHLWCEKPLTHSYGTTCRLFDRAAERGVMAVTALMYKYHPQFLELRRLVQGGTLGDLRALSIRFGIPALESATFRGEPQLGGGALLDFSSYLLSAVYQLFDKPPKLQCAGLWTLAPSRADTDGWAVLEHDNAVIDCAWGYRRAYRNALEVWGTEGSLHVDRVFTKESDYESTLVRYDQRGTAGAVVRTGPANAFCAMLEAFAGRLGDADFQATERAETEWCARVAEQIASSSR